MLCVVINDNILRTLGGTGWLFTAVCAVQYQAFNLVVGGFFCIDADGTFDNAEGIADLLFSYVECSAFILVCHSGLLSDPRGGSYLCDYIDEQRAWGRMHKFA